MPMLPLHNETTSGVATVGNRRPTVVVAPAAVSPELSNRPRRQTFTAADKLRILAATDRALETGGVGAVLRREGVYSLQPGTWVTL
jgi:transposase